MDFNLPNEQIFLQYVLSDYDNADEESGNKTIYFRLRYGIDRV